MEVFLRDAKVRVWGLGFRGFRTKSRLYRTYPGNRESYKHWVDGRQRGDCLYHATSEATP